MRFAAAMKLMMMMVEQAAVVGVRRLVPVGKASQKRGGASR
jgi:hypothetical protein